MPQQGQNWIDLPEITNIFSRYTKSLLFKSIDDLDIQAAQIFLRIRDRESGGELTEPEYLFDAKQNFIYALSRVFEDVTDQDLLNEAEKAMNRNQLNQQKDIKIWAGTLAKDLGKFTD